MKTPIFTVFFIIERWFFKGIHRKNKKVKTVFASILIPKCVFSKTKMQNILNHRVQFIMKITIFRKIKKSCNTKTLWKQIWKFKVCVCFDQKYTYNATSESLIKSVKIITNHGNDQFGVSFGHCVRCVLWFARVWRFAQRFENQPIVTKHIKKQENTQNKTWKNYKNVIFTESLLER